MNNTQNIGKKTKWNEKYLACIFIEKKKPIFEQMLTFFLFLLHIFQL